MYMFCLQMVVFVAIEGVINCAMDLVIPKGLGNNPLWT